MTMAIAEADLELSWAQLPPGPELVIQLAMVDWESLPDRELVAALEAADRQTSWAQSLKLTAVAELARRRQGPDYLPDSDTERRIAGEVSLALTATQGQAEELVWLAETLPERLPVTWAALQYGHLDYDRAKVMCDGLGSLAFDLARGLDAELIGDAVNSNRTELRRKLTKAIKAADPDAYAHRARAGRGRRRTAHSAARPGPRGRTTRHRDPADRPGRTDHERRARRADPLLVPRHRHRSPRPPRIPATGRDAAARPTPPLHLRLPDLQSPVDSLRHRPYDPIRKRRQNVHMQFGATLPRPPPDH
jgi:Domain of unknown function (DUF222)